MQDDEENPLGRPEGEARNGSLGGAAHGGPKAIARVLRLFDLLAGEERGGTAQDPDGLYPNTPGLTLSELSQSLDVPKSTLLSSLRALVSDGFLLSEGSAYRLGPGAYRLAGNIMSAWSHSDIIRHFVRKLAAETRESVGFAIADWEIGQTIYTDAINSTQSVHYAMRVGLRAPLYASAAGRVLLANALPEQVEAYLERTQFRALTPATRTTPDTIRDNLHIVRDLGYCSSFGEMLKDTAAIAVPVFDPAGAVTGALMVAVPIERMRRNHDALLAKIVQAGRQASGQSPDPVPLKESASGKRRKSRTNDADIFAAFLSE